MIVNGGWHYFTLPTCVAAGHYLMRVELIALHNAGSYPGAQFYMECAQIQVTGSGSNTGSNTVSFPGAYSGNDAGIKLSIYDNAGGTNLGGRSYPIPGPAVLQCSGNDNGGGSNPTPTTLRTSITSAPAPTGGAGGAPLYGQCGGQGWTGPKTCTQGTCKATNEWYSKSIQPL